MQENQAARPVASTAIVNQPAASHRAAPDVVASERPAPGRDRFLLGIVAGSVVLILLGIAAVFVGGRPREGQRFDPATPGGVVQAYLEAVRAGDRERAYGYLSRSARADWDRDQTRTRLSPTSDSSRTGTRLVIDPRSESADAAEVKVTISRFSTSSEPFSSSTSHRDVTFRLVREDGAWRIDQPNEPRQFAN